MNIVWSPEIIEDIDALGEYLQNEWPASVLQEFRIALFEKVDLLSTGFLEGRPAERNPSVCSVLITKQNRLYYEIEGDRLLLLRLWDTRQNPQKHPFE